MPLTVVILAAGAGKRMSSDLPKVLHQVGERSMIEHVLDTAASLQPRRIIVVTGHGSRQVTQQVAAWQERFPVSGKQSFPSTWSGVPPEPDAVPDGVYHAFQASQLGTANAVEAALKSIPSISQVLVLCGDVPLLEREVLEQLRETHRKEEADLTILSQVRENPTGYGRIIRESGEVTAIVEEKEINSRSEVEAIIMHATREVNAGVYLFENRDDLASRLRCIGPSAQTGEYYLTDIVAVYHGDQMRVCALPCTDHAATQGVNTPEDLHRVNDLWRTRRLLRGGIGHLERWQRFGELSPTARLAYRAVLEYELLLFNRPNGGKRLMLFPSNVAGKDWRDFLDLLEGLGLKTEKNCDGDVLEIGTPHALCRLEVLIPRISDYFTVSPPL